MSKDDLLSDDHHISRWAPYGKVLKDNNEDPIGFYPQAFEMRENDEGKLSVNWLEYFKLDHQKNIVKAVQSFRKTRRNTGNKSAFAIGNVGNLRQECASIGHKRVKVMHDKKTANGRNKSHAQIIRLPNNSTEVMNALASKVFTEIVKNSSIP